MVRSVARKSIVMACLLLTALAGAACDDDENPTPTTPTPTVKETLAGTITQNGAESKTFSVSAAGTVTATLKSVGEDETLTVGFSLGNWNGTACSIVLANDAAKSGAVLSGTMSNAGTLCLRMFDVGNLPAGVAVPYSVEIEHP